jgi:hypothetical protein
VDELLLVPGTRVCCAAERVRYLYSRSLNTPGVGHSAQFVITPTKFGFSVWFSANIVACSTPAGHWSSQRELTLNVNALTKVSIAPADSMLGDLINNYKDGIYVIAHVKLV